MLKPLIVLLLMFGCVALVIFMVVAVMAFFFLKKRSISNSPTEHTITQEKRERVFQGKKYLFSKGEGAFFRVLSNAVQGRYLIMAKVRLSDLVLIRATGSTWAKARNQIQSKHVDFVLLDPAGLTIQVVIELDDRSHEREDRKDRDALVDQILAEAEIPILHITATYNYDPHQLLRQIGIVCGGATPVGV